MPLKDTMKLISVDDHLIEHPRVWSDRLPAKYQAVGPHIELTDLRSSDAWGYEAETSEAEVWVFEGRTYPRPMMEAVAGRDRSEYSMEPFRYEDVRPGCYDPAERVKDMDEDGVHASICFPTFPRFSGTTFLESEDIGLGLLCVQAYNDFVIEEWCGYAPDRLIPMVILPLWDPALAVEEIRRTAANGAKAISFPESFAPLGLPSFYSGEWDSVLAAAEEADLPLCMHFGTSGQIPKTSPDAPMPVTWALMGTNSMYALVDLLYSPIFHQHPKLKVALSEGGIGWIPYMLEKIDHVWEQHRAYTTINSDVRPSELFRSHVWGCFIDDYHGLACRESIGVKNILWEGDYPHADSNWPHARKHASEQLADVPDEEAHLIVELNARQLFNFSG
jgi:predicted TIM-barrel fold metal-dependent hydrolase